MARRQVVIENPILNSPYEAPEKHWKFTDDGISDEVVAGRRPSSYFIPIAPPKKRGGATQLSLDAGWTQDRVKENERINQIRSEVHKWRSDWNAGRRSEVTPTTRRLLQYWQDGERENRLFFCQIEAIETAIFITEVAPKRGVTWIGETLKSESEAANPGLLRMAFKMATGSGKTLVMAMLIAWHALNRQANPRDSRFSDAFLVISPGITIRDRLRVLLPNDPENYYAKWDLVPPADRGALQKAKIVVTNFHSFIPRETVDAARLTKSILARGSTSAFTENPAQVVNRACREFGGTRNIIVLNDEAHHCYHRRPENERERVSSDDRREVEDREREARVWSSGLDAVGKKIGVRIVYDLSATPFYLKGSGWPEGTLFPWVVSDFSLIDAIESGIVKIPRVPVADDQMKGSMPTYRDLWPRIRLSLPKHAKGTERVSGEPRPPKELEGALDSLYGHYQKYYRTWENDEEARARGSTPPVFIVVCNNTNVSKLVYDHIAGWEKILKDGSTIVIPGKLSLFSNEKFGKWTARPNTILIDSAQLESGEPLSDEFKKIVSAAIEEFKGDYRVRFPGRDVESLTDADILREVMNTVGKPGKLGENVKCVVSVSMLTEGWDANTVTHILGVRAFGTQLLCEQVIGRGLRRRGYSLNSEGRFDPEYAEIYGVPFSFIPCSGSSPSPRPEITPTHVRAIPERAACEITYPRVLGYRYDFPTEHLSARFAASSRFTLSTADLPSRVELDPIVGESSVHDLGMLMAFREQQVAFVVARRTLEQYFRDQDGNPKTWLFPQLLEITKRWMKECLVMKDETFPQWLLLVEFCQAAADRIYQSIVASTVGQKTLRALPQPYDPVGSTTNVEFDTTRNVYPTRADKCHLNYVVADTDSWEQRLALALEGMDEIEAYVKNQNLGFRVPYTYRGEEQGYFPDFIARVRRPGKTELNLILEVTGRKLDDKEVKVSTTRDLWVPAVNNLGTCGEWAFLEITDPYDSKRTIRSFLKSNGVLPQRRLSNGE
jgi:type III restriction enzyme